jgi:hypothetical protein
MSRQGAYNITGAKQLCAIYKGKAYSKAEQVQTTKELLEVAQEVIHLDNKLTDSNTKEFVTKRLTLIKVYIAGQVV